MGGGNFAFVACRFDLVKHGILCQSTTFRAGILQVVLARLLFACVQQPWGPATLVLRHWPRIRRHVLGYSKASLSIVGVVRGGTRPTTAECAVLPTAFGHVVSGCVGGRGNPLGTS